MSNSFFTRLRFRLLLLIFIAVVPILGLTLFRYIELRQMVVSDVKEEALRLARLAAGDQQDTIRDTHQLLFALGQLSEVRRADSAACSALFAQLVRQYPQYTQLGVMTPNGQVFCSSQPLNDLVDSADLLDFRRIIQTRDFTISSYQRDPNSGLATLNFGYPVLDEGGQAQAIIFATLDLTWLSQLASEAQLPQGSIFTVIDRNGTILVRYPDPGVWVGQSVPEAPIIELILAQQGEGTTEITGVDGIGRLFAFTPLYGTPENAGVYISIGIPATTAFADANRALIRNLIGLALVTMLALAAAWFGGDFFILRWVNGMVSATQRLSTGDLSTRVGLAYDQGELGQLARAFDTMVESLQARVAERDQAEAILKETQRALSTLLSNLPGMAYRCGNDSARTMEFVSEGCGELTGYTAPQLVANKEIAYGSLIHPDDRETVWHRVQLALRQKEPFQLTYRLLTASEEPKWVWEQGRGVFSPTGKLLALEGFITDTTERMLAYQLLEQRVADRTRALSALYDVTAVASESLELEMVLERSLDRVLVVMQSNIGAIHLLDETGASLSLAAWRGVQPEAIAQIISVPLNGDQLNDNAFERIVKERKPLIINSQNADSLPLLAMATQAPQVYVGVPMRSRGQVLGVLSVVCEAERQFSQEEVALLDSIGDQIAVAVENARLYGQAEQLAVMKERSRLARDMHDSVTQSLYSATLLAEVGRRSAQAGDLARVQDYLSGLGEAVQQALKEMRLLLYELRPPVLEREGLVGALQQRLDTVEGRAGVETRLLVDGTIELPTSMDLELYRIAQEALNNALKHAAATLVTVRLQTKDNRINLEIEDNGVGFDPEAISGQGGLGLMTMQERVERLEGMLVIHSAPKGGTKVCASIPVEEVDNRPSELMLVVQK